MKKKLVSILCILIALTIPLVGCNKTPINEEKNNEEEKNIEEEKETSKYIDDDSEITYNEKIIERFYPSDDNNSEMESLNNGYGKVVNATDFSNRKTVAGTVHNFVITDTDNYLFQNGKTNYKILISNTATEYEKIASQELQYFIKLSTNCDIEIIKDNEKGIDINGYYLSVGDTALRNKSGVSFNYDELTFAGYKIVTFNKSILMSGGHEYGTLYSVYEFLHQIIGLAQYSKDCVIYDKNVKDIKLKNYNITDIPDIPLFQITAGYMSDSVYSKRLRLNTPDEIMAYPGGWCHNTFQILQPNVYLRNHPDWYSHDESGEILYPSDGERNLPAQICYSCDDEEFWDVILNGVKKWLEDSPKAETLSFSQQDNSGTWCRCDKCKKLHDQYNTDAAVVIQFMNKLYDKLSPWLKENNRNVTLVFFGYHQTVDAPAKFEDGKYVPIDNSVVCNDNVGVMYAPIEADYSKPLTDPANNVEYGNLLKWSALTKKVYLWTYSTDFITYLSPYNSFNSMQANYQTAYENGVYWLLDQQQSYQNNCTGFHILKYFLQSKLRWDVNSDLQALTDEFFDNYFGPASISMRKIYDELRARFSYIENVLGDSMYIYVSMENRNYWSEGLLKQWLGYIDEAYRSIEYLKNSDPELYTQIYDRITLESISYRYLLIEIYGSTTFSTQDLLNEKMKFKADCTYLGVNMQRESMSLSQFINLNWGI